jgi:formate--tetrahydrofolate ligase
LLGNTDGHRCFWDAIEALTDRPQARHVVVTAVTPTPLGEGKTTTTI